MTRTRRKASCGFLLLLSHYSEVDFQSQFWSRFSGLQDHFGYLRQKAFVLRFLDLLGAVCGRRKRVKNAEKEHKKPEKANIWEGR